MKKKVFIIISIIIILPIVICSILLLINNPNRFSEEEQNMTWSPYTIDETNSQPYPEPDKRWILDDNGKRIYYNKSPYFVTGSQNERKYLLGAENLICAVKSGNDFINLLDGKVIEISNGEITKKQPDLGLAFYASKNFVL